MTKVFQKNIFLQTKKLGTTSEGRQTPVFVSKSEKVNKNLLRQLELDFENETYGQDAQIDKNENVSTRNQPISTKLYNHLKTLPQKVWIFNSL